MKEIQQLKNLMESMVRIEEGKKEPWITASGDINGQQFEANLGMSDVEQILAGDINSVNFFGEDQEELARIILKHPDKIREIIQTGKWFAINDGNVVVEFNKSGKELPSSADSTDYGTGSSGRPHNNRPDY